MARVLVIGEIKLSQHLLYFYTVAEYSIKLSTIRRFGKC
jgi:hypothetical protein